VQIDVIIIHNFLDYWQSRYAFTSGNPGFCNPLGSYFSIQVFDSALQSCSGLRSSGFHVHSSSIGLSQAVKYHILGHEIPWSTASSVDCQSGTPALSPCLPVRFIPFDTGAKLLWVKRHPPAVSAFDDDCVERFSPHDRSAHSHQMPYEVPLVVFRRNLTPEMGQFDY